MGVSLILYNIFWCVNNNGGGKKKKGVADRSAAVIHLVVERSRISFMKSALKMHIYLYNIPTPVMIIPFVDLTWYAAKCHTAFLLDNEVQRERLTDGCQKASETGPLVMRSLFYMLASCCGGGADASPLAYCLPLSLDPRTFSFN